MITGKKIFCRFIGVSLALAPFYQVAKADTLLFEDFNGYSNGALLTASGWTATSGAGTNSITVNGGAVSLTTSGEDVSKTFTTASPVLAGGTGDVYAGFDLALSAAQATGDYFFTFAANTTFNGRLYAKSTTGGYLIGAQSTSNGSVVYGSTVLAFNTSYRIVVDYTAVTGTLNDTVSVYIAPVDTSAVAEVTSSWGTNAEATFTAVVLRQGAAGNAATVSSFDNLIVATDFNTAITGVSPVPEPATYAAILGGMALVVGVIQRRRQSTAKRS
jgi:hypothetical protein